MLPRPSPEVLLPGVVLGADEVLRLTGGAVSGVARHEGVGAQRPGQGHGARGGVSDRGQNGVRRLAVLHPVHHGGQRVSRGRADRAGAVLRAGGQEQPGE